MIILTAAVRDPASEAVISTDMEHLQEDTNANVVAVCLNVLV